MQVQLLQPSSADAFITALISVMQCLTGAHWQDKSPSWRGRQGVRQGQEQEVVTLCTQSGSRKPTWSRSGYQVSVSPPVIYFLQADSTSQGFHSPRNSTIHDKAWEHGRNFTLGPQQVGCGYLGFHTSRGLVHRGHLTDGVHTLTAGFAQLLIHSKACFKYLDISIRILGTFYKLYPHIYRPKYTQNES